MNSALMEKGQAGEAALNEWLQANGLSYLYVNQQPATFAPLFRDNVKRPDFLVLLESIGLIAVDVKNQELSGGVYTLKWERELRRVLVFERLFRIPMWYAYLRDGGSQTSWFWISALKAVEVGEVRMRRDTREEFLAVKLEHFECIRTNADIGKLYTHRLPSTVQLQRLEREDTSRRRRTKRR